MTEYERALSLSATLRRELADLRQEVAELRSILDQIAAIVNSGAYRSITEYDYFNTDRVARIKGLLQAMPKKEVGA